MDEEAAPRRPAGNVRTRLGERTVGLRGLVAVALAGLVLGGGAGAGTTGADGHVIARGGASHRSAPPSG